jgi:predicted nucleic acid-binding protein
MPNPASENRLILVDTSVWIDHLKKSNPLLCQFLAEDLVVVHPFVIGELATGMIKNRSMLLGLLRNLPQSPVIKESEYYSFIEQYVLFGKGVGFVDIHILASAIKHGLSLWSLDKRLNSAATDLGVCYP